MAELVFLMDRQVKPELSLLGQENKQALIERIYTSETIFDNVLENQMEHAPGRDRIVRAVLSLLKKKHIVLL